MQYHYTIIKIVLFNIDNLQKTGYVVQTIW